MLRRTWLGAALLAASAVVSAAAEQPAAVERDLAAAQHRWDADAAVAVLTRARALRRAAVSPASALLQVRAGLLAAELLRVRFEQPTSTASADRETIGQRIDAFAGEALALLPALPESSERWRMEADLVATMIRSDFRAKKFEARFRAAVAKARALDPKNAQAIVSEAKPLLFAPPEHGRDYRAGIALLDRALALDPRIEAALLLRAFAHDSLGERAAAEADWRAALAVNPDCEPARHGLAGGAAPR